MKITGIDITVKRAPADGPRIRDALQTLGTWGSVQLTINTDEGISGRGDAGFGRIPGAPDALAAVIEHELKPLVLGQDPAMVRQIHDAMLRETEYHGSFGLTMFAIAAIDTAIWDCLGKARGVPCWQLWGGMRRRVPAYAMCGWLNYDDAKFRAICRQAVDQGFRAVKIKVGYPTLAEDIARVKSARDAVGGDVTIMADANQSLTTAEAVRRGRAFQELGVYWWEEPIPADDIDGYAELADKLDIPVATGENLYTRADFARFLKRDAVDIIQPDLRRGGGPTALLDIGLMASAFRRPYASHGGGPVQLNIMAALPNALHLETGLLGPDSNLKLEDGMVAVPEGSGFSW